MNNDIYIAIQDSRPGDVIYDLVTNKYGFAALYPQIANMMGVPQEPEWHPEGDVLEHTRQVMNQMSVICKRDNITGHLRDLYILSALCHDMDKPRCTRTKTYKDGVTRIVSPGHDAGYETMKFLKVVGIEGSDYDFVFGMVKLHMRHIGFKNIKSGKPSLKSIRKFKRAMAAYGLTVYDVDRMVEADISGRGSKPKMKSPIMQKMIVWCSEVTQVRNDKNPSIIVDGGLLKSLGYVPGPWYSEIIVAAGNAQGVEFSDVSGATAWLWENYAN